MQIEQFTKADKAHSEEKHSGGLSRSVWAELVASHGLRQEPIPGTVEKIQGRHTPVNEAAHAAVQENRVTSAAEAAQAAHLDTANRVVGHVILHAHRSETTPDIRPFPYTTEASSPLPEMHFTPEQLRSLNDQMAATRRSWSRTTPEGWHIK